MSQSSPHDALRDAIRVHHRTSEAQLAATLLALVPEDGASRAISAEAQGLVRTLRETREASPVEALMREYDLSSDEGLVLMEMAEALLRIPDAHTRDLLIRDKLGEAKWSVHAGRSSSLLVNLSTLGLDFGARLVSADSLVSRLAGRIGAPVVRTAIVSAIKRLGDRFVFAESIDEALRRAARDTAAHPHNRYSFDMLGESARTDADAGRYLTLYADAIASLVRAPGSNVFDRPGISVKLSALNPRYEPQRAPEVMRELMPPLIRLAEQAAQGGIGFTIDAEEADRLDMSLDIVEALAGHSTLAGWQGLGLAVQAYQKRCLPVIDWLADLGRRTDRRLMVRLVKGAYWDSEIKRAQVEGLDDYPVYTRKVLTDLSYLAAARRMLGAPQAIYPMFATHNAYTVAAIHHMAGPDATYEFQRLHGMGEALHAAASAWKIPCRVYAPVGPHRDLLAYLVRRLLENGANSSFVNQLADRTIPPERLAENPANAVRILGTVVSNPQIPAPTHLYGGSREACPGVDFGDPKALAALVEGVGDFIVEATPLVSGQPGTAGAAHRVVEPAFHSRVVGTVREAQAADVERAALAADAAYPHWSAQSPLFRARLLERAADLLIEERDRFITLLVREAGRTLRNAVGEWREAVDFLRYYAVEAERVMIDHPLPGPTGESNVLRLAGKGVFVCISPWNFPLSIFLGQVAAALVTGNTVLAKPAGETPLIACEAVRLLHRAGIPADVLHFLPGSGEIGAEAVGQPAVRGVVFTGSTATAKTIALSLAGRDGPLATLIAETGGQNAMIVDSSALLEQATGDILASAFDSAGQRCSALRVLAVQEDVADALIAMVKGAMATLRLGDPALPATDIGPVIHDRARTGLQAHLREAARFGTMLSDEVAVPGTGSFFAPRLIEIDALSSLTREVFGPLLHVIRWRAGGLETLIADINATGYGLTLSVQTRLPSTIETVKRLARVGNIYVNRSQIGAVVGTQPFGGEGLSGTGPKAGGPHYLTRFMSERVVTINTAATGGNAALMRGE